MYIVHIRNEDGNHHFTHAFHQAENNNFGN